MLEISHFSKTYKGGKKAVDDLTISVKAGDIFGFIGHNGAGKSTTIKCLVGILDFEAGTIFVDGHSIKDDPVACKKVIAYLPDNPELYEHLTGIQYLNFIADIFEESVESREKQIKKYAEKFEISDFLGDLISSYSRGMKQKLAIISAVLHHPKLIVLDEPFVGLDPKAIRTLQAVMQQLCANGSAIFFSTHTLDAAEKLCNKVAMIHKGKLAISGEMNTLVRGTTLEELFLKVMANDE